MEKTKQFIRYQYNKIDNEYWDVYDRLQRKNTELNALQNEVDYLAKELSNLENKKNEFEELINEWES